MTGFAVAPSTLTLPQSDCHGMGWDAHEGLRAIWDENLKNTAPSTPETAASEHLAQPRQHPLA